MQTAIFLMAIMGCGEGEAPCQQLRMLETRYESQAQCMAATEDALVRFDGADYPVIVAQCVAAGSTPRLNGVEVALPEPEETPLFD